MTKRLKKRGLQVYLLSIGLAVGFLFPSCSRERVTEIRILHTSDIHANYFAYDFLVDSIGSGSMSRLATFLKEARAQHPNLLLIDGGDIMQGTPSAYYSNYVDTLSVNLAAQTMNYLRYDAGVPGNHDLETGHRVYDAWVKACKHPVLAANVIDVKTNKPYFSPYTIKDVDGIRIAILGFLTPAVPEWIPQPLWEGMGFEDIVLSAQHWVPYVIEHERPDILIGVLHSGLKNTNRHYLENAAEVLAKEVSGFDALLIGHDHRMFLGSVQSAHGDSVYICNPANNLDWVSDLTISVTRRGNKIISKKVQSKLVNLNEYEPDKEYDKAFAEQTATIRRWGNKIVGELENPIDIRGSLFGPTAFLSLVHRVLLNTTGADVSFSAPLNLSTRIAAGPIRIKDLFDIYRFENFLYVMELSGAEIKDYLEFSYGKWTNQMRTSDDHLLLLKPDFKPNDKYKTLHETFNFSSAAGIDYTVDVSKPVGNRVNITQMSNGEPFDLAKKYHVALSSYRAGGGGDLLTEGCRIRFEELPSRVVEIKEKDIRSYIKAYIETRGTINVHNENNWKFIPEAWVQKAIERDAAIIYGQ